MTATSLYQLFAKEYHQFTCNAETFTTQRIIEKLYKIHGKNTAFKNKKIGGNKTLFKIMTIDQVCKPILTNHNGVLTTTKESEHSFNVTESENSFNVNDSVIVEQQPHQIQQSATITTTATPHFQTQTQDTLLPPLHKKPRVESSYDRIKQTVESAEYLNLHKPYVFCDFCLVNIKVWFENNGQWKASNLNDHLQTDKHGRLARAHKNQVSDGLNRLETQFCKGIPIPVSKAAFLLINQTEKIVTNFSEQSIYHRKHLKQQSQKKLQNRDVCRWCDRLSFESLTNTERESLKRAEKFVEQYHIDLTSVEGELLTPIEIITNLYNKVICNDNVQRQTCNFPKDIQQGIADVRAKAKREKRYNQQLQKKVKQFKQNEKEWRAAIVDGRIGDMIRLAGLIIKNNDNIAMGVALPQMISITVRNMIGAKSSKGNRFGSVNSEYMNFLFSLVHATSNRLQLLRMGLGSCAVPASIQLRESEFAMKSIGFCERLIHMIPEFLQSKCLLKDNVQLCEIPSENWKEYIPPVIVSFDATKTNEHVEYLEKLGQVVGFADYMNNEYYEFKTKEDLLTQFEKRLVSDQLLVFLYQLPFHYVSDTFVCLIPISKDAYTSQDVNFVASLVVQKLKNSNLLSKYNMLLSDALACQSTFVECLSNPLNNCANQCDSECVVFSSFQSLSDGTYIGASFDQPHLSMAIPVTR